MTYFLKTLALAAGIAAPFLIPMPAMAQQYDGRVIHTQGRDIIIRHDRLGRRVIVDAWTGDIISVGPLPEAALAEPEFDDPAPRLRGTRAERRDAIRRLRRDYDERSDPSYEDPTVVTLPDPDFEEDAPTDDLLSEPAQPRIKARQPAVAKQAAPKPAQKEKEIVTGGIAKAGKAEPAAAPGKGQLAVAKIQIILDRAGISPGAIDGKPGQNLTHALDAYRMKTGNSLDATDPAGIEEALAESGGAGFANYQITAADAAGPFIASIPADYGQKAQLDGLSYTSTLELLAERFHMSEAYLKALNPQATFRRPGERLTVAATGAQPLRAVQRIVADKAREQVFAYDAAGKLVAAYPATIGSADTPSPSGTVAVERVALNPEYTYNPKLNFKQGENNKVLRIPPGPNGPVGTVWIALSKPTYGIHGTPEPSQIGKTNSHGCVRLTNWDATELAKLVKPGVTVEFAD